jgi:hypothetical protein
LAKQGFVATGFEISAPSARYGREHLNLKMIDNLPELRAMPPGSFDVIFSNHVLEHLPRIRETFALTARLLTPGGIGFHVLPNFTGTAAQGGAWIMWIGEEHPLAPTTEFFSRTLPQHGLSRVVFGSSPFDEELAYSLTHSQEPRTDGDELLVLAYKPTA